LVHAGLFAPDGRSVLTGAWDGTVRSWDAENGAPRWRLERSDGVNALGYCTSRDMLAIAGMSRRIKLVSPVFRQADVTQQRRLENLLGRLDDDSYEVREDASREILQFGLMAEPWLRRLMTESHSTEVRVRCRSLWQQLFTTPYSELSGHREEVDSVAFAPHGDLLASVDRTGTVRLWDVATRRLRGHFLPSEAAGHLDEDTQRGRDTGHPGP
jgi:WD40 repeat protein